MVSPVDYFRSKVQLTVTIAELEAIHSDITAARLSERDYTQIYYDLVAQRLHIIRRVREKAVADLKAADGSAA